MSLLIKHRTLSAAIIDQLRKAILDGTYPAGTQLRQDALAEKFGVSRIPIREALFQLDAEGLVRIIPQKGAVVSEFSIDEINDVFALRILLEPRLLAQSIPLLDAEDFARIDEIHQQETAATKATDISRMGQINADFHRTLYKRTSQPRTLAIVGALLQASDRYTRLQLSSMASMQRALDQHVELTALSRACDIHSACAFLENHIRQVHDDLLRVLGRAEPPANVVERAAE